MYIDLHQAASAMGKKGGGTTLAKHGKEYFQAMNKRSVASRRLQKKLRLEKEAVVQPIIK